MHGATSACHVTDCSHVGDAGPGAAVTEDEREGMAHGEGGLQAGGSKPGSAAHCLLPQPPSLGTGGDRAGSL